MTHEQDEAYNAVAHSLRLTLSLHQGEVGVGDLEAATARRDLLRNPARIGCFALRRGGSTQLA